MLNRLKLELIKLLLNFLSDTFIERLVIQDQITSFDCGVPDLNEFLKDDAVNYLMQLIGVTYLIKPKSNEDKIVSYFTVSNDNLSDEGYKDWKKTRRLLNKSIPHKKLRKEYPAVKIGRFAVCKELERTGLGTSIMNFIKYWFTAKNKTGCKYIIVDSKNNICALNFYKKNGFDFLTSHDENDLTRSMYYDLKKY